MQHAIRAVSRIAGPLSTARTAQTAATGDPEHENARFYAARQAAKQVLVSILAGCETLSELNSKLKYELPLAQVGHWPRFADQSTLSETLDALTLMNLTQLERAVQTIWQRHSATLQHDWRGFLWLDFDLSGLPCSPQAEQSTKGYFSGKKTRLGVR